MQQFHDSTHAVARCFLDHQLGDDAVVANVGFQPDCYNSHTDPRSSRNSQNEWPYYRTICREGYSLLFYGLGSKKALLERFAREGLLDGGVVVFNGYRPTLKLREILSTVAAQFEKPRQLPRCYLLLLNPGTARSVDVYLTHAMH